MLKSLPTFDWIIIIMGVVGISMVEAYFVRYVKTTKGYFLAGRKLKWWQVSAARVADAFDGSDSVSTSGQAYRAGMVNIDFVWCRIGFGFLVISVWLVSFFYRSGVYTNAEFVVGH